MGHCAPRFGPVHSSHPFTHPQSSQIPVTTTEEELQGLFAPYGSIVELALLKKNPSAGTFTPAAHT